MASIRLDDNNNIVLENNNAVIIDGREAIEQHLTIRFKFFFGEWFLDTSLGVPYYEDVLIKRPSFIVVNEVLKNVILETPGVTSIESFNFDYDNFTREAALDFRCNTTDGFIDFSQVVEV